MIKLLVIYTALVAFLCFFEVEMTFRTEDPDVWKIVSIKFPNPEIYLINPVTGERLDGNK